MVSQASFAPHLAHFSRGSLALRLPGPHGVTIAGPSNVLEAPQLPHSTFHAGAEPNKIGRRVDVLVDIAAA